MTISNVEFRHPTAEEIQILLESAYDAGCTRGREEARALQGLVESPDSVGFEAGQTRTKMATMNGILDRSFTSDIRRLRHDLAELEEMVRLGAGIPGDEHRIEMIKGLFRGGA